MCGRGGVIFYRLMNASWRACNFIDNSCKPIKIQMYLCNNCRSVTLETHNSDYDRLLGNLQGICLFMQAKIEQLQSGKEHGEERLACLLKAMIEQLQEVEKRVVALSALSEMQPARRRTEFPGDVARHIANFLDGAGLAA